MADAPPFGVTRRCLPSSVPPATRYLSASGLRFPVDRVLLHRTRLAYVHLRHLLTDAKRDRGAQVYGYVAVWLQEECLLLYLQEGELVNATRTADGVHFSQIALGDALARVPQQAEFGEICFHEADDEQLAMMFWTQVGEPIAWPVELAPLDADALLAYLHATLTDGTLELRAGDAISYAGVRFGRALSGYFTDPDGGDVEQSLRTHLAARQPGRGVRLFPVARPLPAQASPSLVLSYRELIASTVRRLEESGCVEAAGHCERVRRALIAEHQALAHFGGGTPSRTDPVQDAREVTTAVGAWVGALLGEIAPTHGLQAPAVMASLTRERRHSFQSAGLFETLPWPVHW